MKKMLENFVSTSMENIILRIYLFCYSVTLFVIEKNEENVEDLFN